VLPTEGSSVDTESYALCGMWNSGVSILLAINIKCAPSAQIFRYVIVQSLDTEAEQLCLAEVAVYTAGRRAIVCMFMLSRDLYIYIYIWAISPHV